MADLDFVFEALSALLVMYIQLCSCLLREERGEDDIVSCRVSRAPGIVASYWQKLYIRAFEKSVIVMKIGLVEVQELDVFQTVADACRIRSKVTLLSRGAQGNCSRASLSVHLIVCNFACTSDHILILVQILGLISCAGW